jgi:hypothetical protein
MFVKMCAHRLSKDAMSSRVGSVKHRPKRETPRNEDEDIVDKQRRGCLIIGPAFRKEELGFRELLGRAKAATPRKRNR